MAERQFKITQLNKREFKVTALYLIPPNGDCSGLDAVTFSDTRIDLTWLVGSTNEDGISVERSLDGVTFSELIKVGTGITTYSDGSCSQGTTYYYRVRAYKGTTHFAYSNYSNIDSATTFSLLGIISKFAGWWVDNKDQVGAQDREALTQNALSGQVFTGRAVHYDGIADGSWVYDNGALDVGSAPFSVSFWFRSATNTGTFSANSIVGKHTQATSINGRWSFSVHNGVMWFAIQPTGGLVYATVPFNANTWYHIVGVINNTTGRVYIYKDKIISATSAAYSGTFPAMNNAYGFGIATGNYGATGGLPYTFRECDVRDVRIFQGKLLSQADIDELYLGHYVSGFTYWYPNEDNSNARCHDAKFAGALHLAHASIAAGNHITGKYTSVYNDFGYAEDATYGQVPPDMSNLDGSGVPINDCYGNALIFKDHAKYHLIPVGNTLKVNDDSISDELTDIIMACDLISLNTWYIAGVAQAIDKGNILTYCAGRQFYDATNNNLIFMKEGQFLTFTEEQYLINSYGVITLHAYGAESTAYFARLTGTFTNLEKSKLDNIIRLLVSNGIWAECDVIYLPCLNNVADSYLQLKSASYPIVPSSAKVSNMENVGIGSNDAIFSTGFDVAVHAVQYTRNDAMMTVRLAKDQKVIDEYLFVYATTNVYLFFKRESTQGFAFIGQINCVAQPYWYNGSGDDLYHEYRVKNGKTTVLCRYDATTIYCYQDNKYMGVQPTASQAIGGGGNLSFITSTIANLNYLSFFALGGYLNAIVSKFFGRIVDNYVDGNIALTATEVDSTNYTYYLNDKYIVANLGLVCVWSDYKYLYYSTDLGASYVRRIAFNTYTLGFPSLCHIFDNGNILLMTLKNTCYLSTDNLQTINLIVPTDEAGNPYIPHVPVNPTYPGDYFRKLGNKYKTYIGAQEIFVWGNYGNALTGANPVNIYYSLGMGVKIAYQFGQNQYRGDDGTNDGGLGGALLGDPLNSTKCSHVHSVTQDPDNENDFYVLTGDIDRPAPFYETHWLKGTYNVGADTWIWSVLHDGQYADRYQGNMIKIQNGRFYWSSDAGGVDLAEKGYFHCLIADLNNTANHTQYFLPISPLNPLNWAYLDGDYCIGSYAAGSGGAPFFTGLYLITSIDGMVSFQEELMKIPGEIYNFQITKIANKKYLLSVMLNYSFPLDSQSIILTFK